MALLAEPLRLLGRSSLLHLQAQAGMVALIAEGGVELRVEPVALIGDEVGVGDAGVGGLEDGALMAGLADDLEHGVLPGVDAGGADAVLAGVGGVGEARGGGEDAAGVGAVELAGFGGGVEELGERHGVHGEVVDGFGGGGGGGERGGGNHGVDGFGVGEGEGFFLCVRERWSVLWCGFMRRVRLFMMAWSQRVVICLNNHHEVVCKTNRILVVHHKMLKGARIRARGGLPLLSIAFPPRTI